MTRKQERFVQKYMLTLNATEACRQAGFADTPSLKKTASRLLDKPDIKAEIARLSQQAADDARLTASTVLEGLGRIIKGDIRRMHDKDGKLLPLSQMGDAEASIISSFEVTKANLDPNDGALQNVVRVRTLDRAFAYQILARHFKLIQNDAPNINVSLTLVSNRLQAARKRIASAPPLLVSN